MAWSLDWFTARAEAVVNDLPIRRVAWPFGTWMRHSQSLWWMRTATVGWQVVKAGQFGASDLRARDWTTESYHADICGGYPAYNTTAPARRDWGDRADMRPIPVPSFPDDISTEAGV
jgi:hypothetical protein